MENDGWQRGEIFSSDRSIDVEATGGRSLGLEDQDHEL
jgi:hypothetical protein